MRIRLGLLLVVLGLLMLLSAHEYRQHQQNLQVKQKYLLKIRQQELKPKVKSDFSIYFPILMNDAKKCHLKPMRMVPLHNRLLLTLKGEYQHFIDWFQVIQKRVPELKWIQISMESMPEVGLIYQLKGIYEV
jgi:hypothetical protein